MKRSPWVIKITDENAIPKVYKKEKVTIVIDKNMLKAGITNGDILFWAEIEYIYYLLITPR